MVYEKHTITIGDKLYTAHTTTKAGSLTVKAELTDATVEAAERSKTAISVDFVLEIPAAGEEPEDVKDILTEYVDKNAGDPIKTYENGKYTYAAELLSEIKDSDSSVEDWADVRWEIAYDVIARRARITAGLINDKNIAQNSLRLNIKDFDIEEPEAGTGGTGDGALTGTLHVWGTRYGGDDVEVGFKFAIPELSDLTTAETAINTRINDELLKGDNVNNLITEGDILAAAEEVKGNRYITVAYKPLEEDDLKSDDNKLIQDPTDSSQTIAGSNWTEDDLEKLDYAFKKQNATRKAAGYIRGILLLTDTHATDANRTATVSFGVAISKQEENETTIINTVKKAVGIKVDNDEQTDYDGILKALILKGENKEEGVYEAILEAANDAVEKDGYSVDHAEGEAGADGKKPKLFTFKPAAYKVPDADQNAGGSSSDSMAAAETEIADGQGEISFTLVITDEQHTEGTGDDVTIESKPLEGGTPKLDLTKFGPWGELQTLADAESDIKALLAKIDAGEEDTKFTNETKISDVLTAIESAIVSDEIIKVTVTSPVVPEDQDNTKVSVVTKPADFTNPGTYTITFKLDKTKPIGAEEKTRTFTYDGEIPAIAQTIDEAQEAADAALEAWMKRTWSNADVVPIEEEEANEDPQVLETLADGKTPTYKLTEELEGELQGKVDAAIDTAKFKATIEVTAFTAAENVNKPGSVEIKVTIAYQESVTGGEPSKTDPVAKPGIIELTQNSIEEAKEAVESAVKAIKKEHEDKGGYDTETADDSDGKKLAASILAAANAVVKENVYNVAWKDDAPLEEKRQPMVMILVLINMSHITAGYWLFQ